jgi:hypothetical protein
VSSGAALPEQSRACDLAGAGSGSAPQACKNADEARAAFRDRRAGGGRACRSTPHKSGTASWRWNVTSADEAARPRRAVGCWRRSRRARRRIVAASAAASRVHGRRASIGVRLVVIVGGGANGQRWDSALVLPFDVADVRQASGPRIAPPSTAWRRTAARRQAPPPWRSAWAADPWPAAIASVDSTRDGWRRGRRLAVTH